MRAEIRGTRGWGKCEGHKIPAGGGSRLCLHEERRVCGNRPRPALGEEECQNTPGAENNCKKERDQGQDWRRPWKGPSRAAQS